MPIYEYRCDKCDREFEVEQRITDPPLGSCPKCRSRKLRRLISQTSFVLKGGGWYSDLYSSKSKPDTGSKETGGDAKETTDSKPSEAKDTSPSQGSEGPGGSGGKKDKKGKKKSEPKAAA